VFRVRNSVDEVKRQLGSHIVMSKAGFSETISVPDHLELKPRSLVDINPILGRAERGRGLRSDWTRAGGGHHLLIR
jgi:hypothetical protein